MRLAEDTPPAAADADATNAADVVDANAEPGDASAEPTGRTSSSLTLLVLGLLWLAATMWAAHAVIAGNATDAALVVSSAALALPGVIAASLFAGAAAGLTASGRQRGAGRPRSTHQSALRTLTGVTAGGVCGLIAAGVILFAYGTNSAVAVLAITVGVAALLGGAASAAPPPVLAAGLAGTLGVFATGVVLNLFQSPLKRLLGAGDTVASQVSAAHLFSYLAAAVSGLVAGLIAFYVLRRRWPETQWPAYLAAGSTAGILALFGEGLTQIGGSRLLGMVANLSATDRSVLDYLVGARLESALIIGFVGGIAAMVAFGRTMRP